MDKFWRMCCTASEVEERLQNDHPYLSEYEIAGKGCDLAVTFEGISADECDMLYDTFSDVIYGDDERNLAATLVSELAERGLKLATAESLTGGMVASSIVDVAGCSEVFYGGVVAYSEHAKMDKLGVCEDTLLYCTAVSGDTAVEMATGLLDENVDIGISTTGIAGPGGGTLDKPVGLVYIAVTDAEHTNVYEHRFKGSRQEIRRQAKDCALFYALKHLQLYY